MNKKIAEIAVKIYKPEILNCPICDAALKYKFTLSNKVIQFTSGKYFRIKNLGYGCPICNDGKTYFSQTANKLSFKGYTYSAKVICMIDYYKTLKKGREEICDNLAYKGIEISDRNIDIIHKMFRSYYNADYDKKIHDAYQAMMKDYQQIRIALDLITINEVIYVILDDFFTSEKLAIWKFNGFADPLFESTIAKYINKELKITYIVTIRNIFANKFMPTVKALAPNDTKIIAFMKF